MNQYTILIAEDDVEISNSIAIYLRNQNYDVVQAFNGKQAVDLFRKHAISLVIMDLMMPIMSGETATMLIRQESYVPIIILSAKSEDYDKISGLNIGADDYITKPFVPMELVARVNSHLRRFTRYQPTTPEEEQRFLQIGGITLDMDQKQLLVDGTPLRVTATEYKILAFLMRNPNRVFSTEQIYEHVWEDVAYSSNTVTVHIRRIREKIEIDPKNPRYLQVVWGIGYRFCDPKTDSNA